MITIAGLSEECGVSVGDRVVWLTEEYPELGWVRWTGKQPGLDGSPGWMVGVEFVSLCFCFGG